VLLKENLSTIIVLQETHFKENDAKGMDIIAGFKTHHSIYDGDRNRHEKSQNLLTKIIQDENIKY
jgi:hypothetical protein